MRGLYARAGTGRNALIRRSSASARGAATAEFIRDHYGDALAVEMEGRGFLEAVHISHSALGGVVRGISDLLSGKRRADKEGSQERAADAACAVAFEILAGLTDI